MAEDPRPSGVGPTQDGFSALDQLRSFRTPSMSAINAPSENMLFDALRAQPLPDTTQYAPQTGTSYTEAQRMTSTTTQQPVQFDVFLTGQSTAIVSLGYVRCVDPDVAVFSAITDWEPTIGGVPLSASPSPEITVAAGQVLYCEVKTNNKGIVVETPRIVVGAPDDTGLHYQPPQKTPREGSLRYPLAKFEQSGGELVATQIQQGGPILVQPTLWEGRNVGGFRELYKERQNAGDYYEFRTLEQLAEDSQAGLSPIPILKPEPEGGEGDSIPFRFLTQKPDSSDDEAQIKVQSTDGGAGIVIRGNGFNSFTTDSFVAEQKTRDGLVVSLTPVPFGLTQEVRIPNACNTRETILGFERGLLVSYEERAIAP